jgi:uncharacterized membrane protein
MSRPPAVPLHCPVCREPRRPREIIHGDLVSGPLCKVIQDAHPEWSDQDVICLPCVNHFRARYVADALEAQMGELSSLDEEVVKSLREHELVSENLNVESDSQKTLGQRVADRVAGFGGSWSFILSFAAVLAGWIVLNTAAVVRRPFDPYPYILLNLVLSCVAALQAPVIMMSQNRQAEKDRMQANQDYQINLMAEMEIRDLHDKLDGLRNRQWHELWHLQQRQLQLLEHLHKEISHPEDATTEPGPYVPPEV